MKCHGCSSLMVLDKQEFGSGSSTQWHSCPLCGKVRLTSQPESKLNSDSTAVNKRAKQSINQNLPLASYSTT